MSRWKWAAAAAVAVVVSVAVNPAARAAGAGSHPATGVGSCTLRNWNPSGDPDDATNLPEGDRPQTYKPDDYNCTGARFAAPGVEFTKFPQPGTFHITNRPTVEPVGVCRAGSCAGQLREVWQPTAAVNPL